MYAFYADESGFSKGSKLERAQPITVFAGVLIDRTKLFKALRVFEEILNHVNNRLDNPVSELKFNDIKQSKYPYNINFPKVDDKARLLEKIISDFQNEISFKVFYSAIEDAAFFKIKKARQFSFTDRLRHPYLAASYHVISQIQHYQHRKKNNKGKTFVVLDEQNIFQNDIEELVANPIHIPSFTEVIDTAYFGKSHYSKLIQIADLIAGIIRFNLTNHYLQKPQNHFNARIHTIYGLIEHHAIKKNSFASSSSITLSQFYQAVEIKTP